MFRTYENVLDPPTTVVCHVLTGEVLRLLDTLRQAQDDLTVKKRRQRLARMTQIVEDMATLIREISDYARVDEDWLLNRLGPTDCMALFHEARAALDKESEAVGASVTASHLPIVLGDRYNLLLVFQHLLSNAIKYRSERRLKVRVSAKLQNGMWVFSVRDNGMGIEKHNKYIPDILPAGRPWERIFNVFIRGDVRGPHGEIAGHGIGLSFCRRMIERHGGKIWVESSEVGKGSTFQFTLPVVPEAVDQA